MLGRLFYTLLAITERPHTRSAGCGSNELRRETDSILQSPLPPPKKALICHFELMGPVRADGVEMMKSKKCKDVGEATLRAVSHGQAQNRREERSGGEGATLRPHKWSRGCDLHTM